MGAGGHERGSEQPPTGVGRGTSALTRPLVTLALAMLLSVTGWATSAAVAHAAGKGSTASRAATDRFSGAPPTRLRPNATLARADLADSVAAPLAGPTSVIWSISAGPDRSCAPRDAVDAPRERGPPAAAIVL